MIPFDIRRLMDHDNVKRHQINHHLSFLRLFHSERIYHDHHPELHYLDLVTLAQENNVRKPTCMVAERLAHAGLR
jgi:hypothetical protein